MNKSKGIFNKLYQKTLTEKNKKIIDKWGEALHRDIVFRFLFEKFTYEEFDKFLTTLEYFGYIDNYTLKYSDYDYGCANEAYTLYIGTEYGGKELWEIFGRCLKSYSSVIEFLYGITVEKNKNKYKKSIYMYDISP